MKRSDRVEERGGEFFILSEEGEELEGPIVTRQQAEERLRQIEAAKAARPNEGSEDTHKGPPGSHERLWTPDHQDAVVRRYDYLEALHTDPRRSDGVLMHETPEGFLRADARPARIGVLEYQDAEGNRWGELRTPGEVFSEDSLRSFDLATVTDDHPVDFVSAANIKDVQVGSVGTDAHRDGRFVRVSIVVTDADTIRAIKDGKRELSCGYTAQVISDDGMADGMPFAARQTNIRINHIAVVDKGRAGAECSVLARGDAFHLLTTEVPMTTKKIKIGDVEHEVPEEVADAYEATRKKLLDDETLQALQDSGALDAEGQVQLEFLQGKKNDKEPEKKDSEAGLRAKVDVLEAKAAADDASFTDRVDARSRLVASATTLGIATEGKTDAAIMREIVIKELPSMADKLDANKDDAGYLRATYDQAMDLRTRRDAEVRNTNEVIFEALKGDGKGDIFEDALTSYANRGKAKA